MFDIMASADPALCNFAAKHHIQLRCIPRFSPSHLRPTISTLSCRCALGSKSFPAPLAPTEASWSARARKKEKGPFYGIDREGFSSRVDRKAVERDASVTISEEGGALELVDTDGITFEEGDDINGMLHQPRSYLNAENWQMFAADEGARPGEDDETGSESELEDGGRGRVVRRRKAEEIFESFPDTTAGKWTAADKERVRALHAFQHR